MAQIVTITNPLTGQPAQVDQLDHTAQEIDDASARALPGRGIDTHDGFVFSSDICRVDWQIWYCPLIQMLFLSPGHAL